MNNKTCPSCGSENIDSTTSTKEIILKNSMTVRYDSIQDTCKNCNEIGDFQDLNSSKIEEAILLAEKTLAPAISKSIEQMQLEGIKLAYVERSFCLPQRTLSRWKSEGASAPAVALVNLVKTFPWLTRVAESNYDKSIANQIMLYESVNLISGALAKHDVSAKVVLRNDLSSFHIFGEIQTQTATDTTPAENISFNQPLLLKTGTN